MFALKHDFYASLDVCLQETVNLVGLVDMTVEHGNLPGPIKEKLAEQVGKLKAALFQADGE